MADKLNPKIAAELRKIKKIPTAEELTIVWARAAYVVVKDEPYPNWRYYLASMRNTAFERKVNCPFSIPFLMQLAETYHAVHGDFDRGVPLGVLITGRRLPDLLDVIQPDMTVKEMKAIVVQRQDEFGVRYLPFPDENTYKTRMAGMQRIAPKPKKTFQRAKGKIKFPDK